MISLSFRALENILGAILPKAAQHTTWWSNDEASLEVQCKAWLGAGFQVQPDVKREMVTFVRTRTDQSPGPGRARALAEENL